MTGGDDIVDVLVVGAGPVGVTLANHLGLYGVDTLVIDREHDIIDYPRAVGMDDESLRCFQTVGLADELLADMMQDIPLRMFTADGRCFADIAPATREFGWSRRNIFMQPLLEATVRAGLGRYECVRLELGCELVGFEQHGDGVRATVAGPDGPRQIRAKYLVGADGGRSTVRKLTGLGFEGTTHERQWVVIDTRPDPLDAPFTALHCRPTRPFVSVYLPYGYRRWEFMVLDGEDADSLLEDDRLLDLVSVQVDRPEELTIVRRRVYTHHSRVLASFQQGRVLLAGDAAHLSPPWVGQGLNLGLRDAANLGWKLAAVTQGVAGPRMLETYDAERRGHAAAMIRLADYVGALLSVRSRALAMLRDGVMMSLRRLPGVRDWVLQMKFKPMPHYSGDAVVEAPLSHPPGGRLARRRSRRPSPVGRMFPQPWVETADGRQRRLDDVIGSGWGVLAWRADPALAADDDARSVWEALGARFIEVHPSRRRPADSPDAVEDLNGDLRRFFDGRQPVAIVRPDRYLAALCTPADLPAVTATLARALGCRR